MKKQYMNQLKQKDQANKTSKPLKTSKLSSEMEALGFNPKKGSPKVTERKLL